MKNLLIVEYDLSETGGGETVAVKLANEFSRFKDSNTYLLSICTKTSKIPYEIDDNVKLVLWKTCNKKVLSTILLNTKRFNRFLNEKKISLVIFIGCVSSLLAMFIKNRGLRIISCDHSGLINQWSNKKTVLCKWIQARYCDHLIVLNERIKEEFERKFKCAGGKIVVIPNWFEKPTVDYKYEIDSKRIVSVGRLSKEKGYGLLLKAADIVYKSCPEWKWDIYGDGPMRRELEKKINERSLNHFLSLKGNVKNAADLLPGYAMLVLTSYREAMPLVILEAKSRKLPVISFDIRTGPAEMICNGTDGYLIEPFHVKQMAEKIIFLIKNSEERIQMSCKAGENLEEFSKEQVLLSWKKLLESI